MITDCGNYRSPVMDTVDGVPSCKVRDDGVQLKLRWISSFYNIIYGRFLHDFFSFHVSKSFKLGLATL